MLRVTLANGLSVTGSPEEISDFILAHVKVSEVVVDTAKPATPKRAKTGGRKHVMTDSLRGTLFMLDRISTKSGFTRSLALAALNLTSTMWESQRQTMVKQGYIVRGNNNNNGHAFYILTEKGREASKGK